MALGIARTNAFEGICMAAGGNVRSQTKVFRTDTERTSTALNTTVIRSMCPDVDITGAEIAKDGIKVVREGTRFRAYVLVALPMGEANILARTKENDRLQRRAVSQRDREFNELDRNAKSVEKTQ
jgi:Ca2+/H+ antiporter